MNGRYAEARLRKPHLIYRYRTRAHIVADMAFKYCQTPAPWHILDLGSADGMTLLELDRLIPGCRITGIERSPELVQKAPALPENLELLVGDCTALPDCVRDRHYDVVSALALLEHLPGPLQAVAHAAQLLRPRGLFIATCPNPTWDALSTRLGLLDAGQHEQHMDRLRLQQLIRDAGLDEVSFTPFMWAPLAFLPYLGVPVSPTLSLTTDRIVRRLPFTGGQFVNQCVVGRKPSPNAM